jgi:AraC-like DNA-binding protein
MRAIRETQPPLQATSMVACDVVRGRDFGCAWHFHPEMEIILILSGGTERWIGDSIAALRDGDLYFIGPNLPHDFRNNVLKSSPMRHVHAIVIQFPADFLGDRWLLQTDMSQVHRLFELSAHGLQVMGPTRARAARLIHRVPAAQGLQRLILTLEILSLFSRSQELRCIASPGFAPEIQHGDTNRINLITTFIQEHLTDPIYIDDVALHVGMSTVSFSRYFRQRTGRTFPAYLNEVRVARVCRHLAETDNTVTEIALSCGFDSWANFETQFTRMTGMSPKAYRQRALRIGITERLTVGPKLQNRLRPSNGLGQRGTIYKM